jgi:uncharacterized protein YbcI
MKTQGEIEAAVCEGISLFEQNHMGRGPKEIHCHLIGDLLVVRLKGILTGIRACDAGTLVDRRATRNES